MNKLLSLILLLGLFSCGTQQNFSSENPHTLSFGSGGGFANQTTEYRIHTDGKVWKYRGLENDSSLLLQLKKGKTKKVFKQAYKLGLDTLVLNEPGNMTYFIELKSEAFDNKLKWSKDKGVAEVTEFYTTLINHTKSQ